MTLPPSDPKPAVSRRRFWTLATVAVVSAGAGLAWQRWRGAPPAADLADRPATLAVQDPATATSAPAPVGADATPGDWWAQRFDRPEGGELTLASLRGQPLLVNFWATWCPPCVREMPQLDRFARTNPHGVRVVGLAVDSPSPVRQFLEKTPVGFPIGLAGFAGTELARSLGNAGGGLPFSVLFDAAGAVVQRKLGETHHDELIAWAAALRR